MFQQPGVLTSYTIVLSSNYIMVVICVDCIGTPIKSLVV